MCDTLEAIAESMRIVAGRLRFIRRRLLADIESKPEFPIPQKLVRVVSYYSEDASD